MLCAILSPFIFSIMNALVKAATLSIPSNEVAFFRSIIGTGIIFVMMKNRKIAFSTTGIPTLTVRGILGALYMIAYFYTLSRIPLADASILVNLAPVFVILLAAFFLKEKLSCRSLAIVPVFFIGAVLTVKPYNFSAYSVDALFGVLCAVLSAFISFAIRYLSKNHHTYEIIFYFMAATTVVSAPLTWNEFVMPNPGELLYLLAIGLVSLAGQVVNDESLYL